MAPRECIETSASLSQDAAIVMALARMAMPRAASAREEAERWLRLLRMHGEAGAALQSLGVGEAPLEADSSERAGAPSEPAGRDVQASLELVCVRAHELARAGGGSTVGTVHVLFAVLSVYGSDFDREIYRRGSSRDELFARLARDGDPRASGQPPGEEERSGGPASPPGRERRPAKYSAPETSVSASAAYTRIRTHQA